MSLFARIRARLNENEDFRELKSITPRHFLNGQIFTLKMIQRQYLLMGLLVLLSIVHIDNRYASEKEITRINQLNKQIQDARYQNLTLSAELEEICRRSNIERLIREKGMNLRTGINPPVVIE